MAREKTNKVNKNTFRRSVEGRIRGRGGGGRWRERESELQKNKV